MNDPREAEQEARAGLCASCRHARVVANDRGSRFWCCERSRTDARYARYPPLPVRVCPGYEPAGPRPVSSKLDGR